MLDLDLGLMLFVLVIFFSLLYFLNQILYKPLLKFMDDRDNSIADDLKSAKERVGNSDELRAKAEAILAEAKAEANAIREKAVNDAKTVADSRVESKMEELDKKYQAFLNELSKNRAELKNSLSKQLPLFKESLRAKIGSL